MALTKAKVREILSSADIPSDKLKEAVDAIISGHTDSIEALREERDQLRDELSKAKEYESKLKEAEAKLEAVKDYDEIKKQFDEFKKTVNAEKEKGAKEKAYRELLSSIGVADKRISAIMKVTDLGSIEVDKDGKIKGADKLTEGLKTEWAEFISSEHKEGADTPKPQSNAGGSKLTKEEIYKIKDSAERQKAIAENIDLFQ